MKLLALPLVLALTGCFGTGGTDGAGAIALGSVVIYSQVAKDAKSGEQKAQSLWCGTLDRVHGQLALWKDKDKSEDDLVQALTQSVYDLARQNGYNMHATQVRMVILDAHHVTRDKDVLARELKSCETAI